MDAYENTAKLRKLLTERGQFFIDVPRDGFKRTCFRMDSLPVYFYFDDYGYASYITFGCPAEIAADVPAVLEKQLMEGVE